jgi:hypothetical protein
MRSGMVKCTHAAISIRCASGRLYDEASYIHNLFRSITVMFEPVSEQQMVTKPCDT